MYVIQKNMIFQSYQCFLRTLAISPVHARRLYVIQKDIETPLVRHLKSRIKIQGPLSTADYMREILTNPLSGYYMKKENVFGSKGDFITSPEISHLFGEMIGLWLYNQWHLNGSPTDFQLIELGPGRGTLLADVLKTIGKFEQMYSSLKSVSLVEASAVLMSTQASILSSSIVPVSEEQKKVRDVRYVPASDYYKVGRNSEHNTRDLRVAHGALLDGKPVNWYSHVNDVPKGTSFLLAHEYFDALPTFSFEYTAEGWREIMIDFDDTAESNAHFRFVLSKSSTLASRLYVDHEYLKQHQFVIGDRVEVSMDSYLQMQTIASLCKNNGCALIIDYGENHFMKNTLQAIRSHKFTELLETPGESDLSAWVDFAWLKYAVRNCKATRALGPITQSNFLHSAGIVERIERLRSHITEKEKNDLLSQYRQLTDEMKMGKKFKCLALVPKDASAAWGYEKF